MKAGDVVLVDTNVIIEGHLRSCWAALTGGFRIQTVETCVIEAMTGRHDWQQTKPTEAALRGSLDEIHTPSRTDIARVLIEGGALLDPGERDLWAHALTRSDSWILCGPDRTSMRFGVELKQRERLVSLGRLLKTIDHKPKVPLREHFEDAWLDEVVRKLILGLL